MKNAVKGLLQIALALIIISAAFALLVYTLHAFAYLFISVVMLFAGAVI